MSQPATSPKKRALMPSTPLRSRLRGHGHALDAIVRIGKAGVTPAITAHLTKALFDHELVKVKLEAECPDDRYTVADQLGNQPGVNVVQILGRTILLYKRHPQEPRFEGKRAAEGGNADGSPPKPRGNAAIDADKLGGQTNAKKTGKQTGKNAHKANGAVAGGSGQGRPDGARRDRARPDRSRRG